MIVCNVVALYKEASAILRPAEWLAGRLERRDAILNTRFEIKAVVWLPSGWTAPVCRRVDGEVYQRRANCILHG
jgi:hypothetical protein